VALLILTIGLVSMAELLAVSLRLQALSRNETEAVRLATDKRDQLMSLSFDLAPEIQVNGVDSLASDVDDYFDHVVLGESGKEFGYTRRWDVAAGPDGSANLREVTILIIPDQADRRTQSPYQLVTVIRRW
jgi:Tfp pilus assembly protein PilV